MSIRSYQDIQIISDQCIYVGEIVSRGAIALARANAKAEALLHSLLMANTPAPIASVDAAPAPSRVDSSMKDEVKYDAAWEVATYLVAQHAASTSHVTAAVADAAKVDADVAPVTELCSIQRSTSKAMYLYYNSSLHVPFCILDRNIPDGEEKSNFAKCKAAARAYCSKRININRKNDEEQSPYIVPAAFYSAHTRAIFVLFIHEGHYEGCGQKELTLVSKYQLQSLTILKSKPKIFFKGNVVNEALQEEISSFLSNSERIGALFTLKKSMGRIYGLNGSRSRKINTNTGEGKKVKTPVESKNALPAPMIASSASSSSLSSSSSSQSRILSQLNIPALSAQPVAAVTLQTENVVTAAEEKHKESDFEQWQTLFATGLPEDADNNGDCDASRLSVDHQQLRYQ